ncbi:PTS lactose/cellobiose transporter subunit IIA [Peribacillus muralis]|uniref:PTS lactose/cellobiose transporter subunit IIA n=1 Tax=Peribacillus muralis TaxID=264697 RepID=UPI0007112523|nr:PTS lactose/cellobiose transporter subunit IIA [Peribacillus muralis]
MNEQVSQNAMQLIFYAGNAKSLALKGIIEAENGEVLVGYEKINEAKAELNKGHSIQTRLMTDEINGNEIEKSILLIHAQDHFMSASLSIELSERILKLYEKLGSGEKVLFT